MNEESILSAGLRPMTYWSVQVEDKIAQWMTGKPDGRSTGFKSLDGYIRLIDTELTLIAARPSMGKTALAMQIAENVARELQKEGDPGCAAVFSAEMSGVELTIRMAGALSGVNTHNLRNNRGTKEEMSRFADANRTLRELPIWIDDASGPTTAGMLAQLSKLMETIPVRLMLFDFVELGGDLAQKEDIRVSNILRNLKGIAKTLKIPVIGLSQLSREVEARGNKMPVLSDLRYSGMAEQIADKVVFIMRPEYYVARADRIDVPEEDKKGVAYVMIAKTRNGPVGMVKMAFMAERMKFGDLEVHP